MNKLKIVWSEDSYNCETCGWNYSSGAAVELNGGDNS